MSIELLVPGKRVAKLILVEVNDGEIKGRQAKQSNKFYNMYEQNDATFIVEYGRVDSTSAEKVYPIDKWDSTLKSKTQRSKSPYKDVTHLFQQNDGTTSSASPSIIDVQDVKVRTVLNSLQSYAQKSVQQNYTISSRNVTQAMIDQSQLCVDNIVNEINQGLDIAKVNKDLLHLYHIIPRKMGNVNDYLLNAQSDKQSALKIIEDEQQTLDVMAGQVNLDTQQTNQPQQQQQAQTLLSILGLEMVACNDSEIATIKKLMGDNARQFKNGYAVKNLATQRKFENHIENAKNKTSQLFWHGSRNQNWLNIISTGLMIRPAGAIHNGSMFGDGIYLADKCQKSIGYTSLRGSYWTSGGDNTAYLALFSVHVGEQKHIKHHDSSCYRLCKNVLAKDGYDSVFAHGGADLRNNEYIVYDGCQSTISYLVEIGN